MRDFSKHPIQVILPFAQKNPNFIFNFNKYEIAESGKQFNAKHKRMQCYASDLSEEWLEKELNNLSPRQELAFLSLIEYRRSDH